MRKFYVLLIAVLFAACANAQIGVTVTGNTNTTPNLSATYTSLANALSDLNSVTAMSGPVTLTLAAGASETAPPTGLTIGSASLNAVLSATNTVTIVKAAGGATVLNAGIGTSTPGSAVPDGILKLTGADYITIDGLTFTDGNAANPATMEYGVGLFKLSASDGCNNNTIRNCTFNMQRVNNASGTSPMFDGAVAIIVINSVSTAATTSLTPTNGGTIATNGTNSNNKIYGNTINGGNIGIGFSGYAASSGVGPTPVSTTFLGDLGNDIGGNSGVTGNTILNYGGAAAATNPAAGIRANNQWSINISYNNINNNDGGGVNHVTTLRGIYAQAGTSANATINNNTISIKSAATTSVSTAIENAIGSTAASNTININNNTIQNCTYTTATSATYTGILNSATATNVIANNNSILNNTIGISGSANSCTFQGIYSSGSPTNFTANSNTITGNSINNSYGTMYCIRASTSTLSYDGNTISNNGFPNNSAATSVTLYGFYDGSSPVNESYTNNNINNLYVTGNSTATGHSIYGIYNLTASGTKIFTGNNINNLSFVSSGTGYASVTGIRNAYTATSTISKNVIHTLSSTGATPTVVGIYLGSSVGTTYNVYNNLVGNLSTPQSTGFNLFGIYCGSIGTNINLSFNTVYLNGTSSGSGFASAAVYMSSTTPTVTMINNILVNLSTPTGAGISAVVRRTTTTLTAYGTTSNYNQFYAGTPSATKLLYYDGTNSYQTMSAYKTAVAPRESNSFSEAVSSTPGVYFQSLTGPASGLTTTFLHLVNGLTTQCESGGVVVAGISDDYDGDTRNATNPDVGADEFNGVAIDLNGPAISYSTLQNTLCLSNRTLTATITDATGVNVTAGTKPRIYFKKSTNANTFVDNTNGTNGWKYAEASNASSPFNLTIDNSLVFGGVAPGEIIQYFVVAQDLVATPNISINSGTFAVAPASVNLTASAFPIGGTINSYTVLGGGLSGTVTIGAAGTYPTLTGAGGLFAAINSGGLSGNVTANIIDALVTEPGTNALNNITYGCAASYTLTIKPNTTATLTGSVGTGAVIKFNGADNVIIDGSNSGGTDRSLTIQNTTTTTSGNAVIWLAAPSLGDGASNNVIKNCIIEGNAATTTFLGIYQGGSTTISLTAAGNDNNNNNSYTNNLFRKMQNGLALFGYLANSPDLNNSITNNNFGTAVSGEGFSLIGINTDRQNGLIVSGNEVQNIVNATTASNVFGIRLLDFKNGLAFNNKVHDMLYTGTSTAKYYGIAVTSSTYTTAGNPSNGKIYNNIVYKINSSGTSATWNTTGILASAGYGDKFYYNSVNLTGQVANSSSGLVAAFANGDANITSVCTNIDVRDNIFSLTGSSATAGGNFYAYYTGATTLTGSILNYNDLYCAGTGATNNVGRFNGINYATLAAWQAASGQDGNSISADPLFNTATNLVLLPGTPAFNAGTPISGITVDILGATRSASTPTMGAYEQVGDVSGPTIVYTAIGNTLCATNRTITATITDASGVNVAAGTKPRIYFKKTTNANTFVDNTNATDGWKYAEASNASSPFNLTIDNSLVFGGVAPGDIIQYFVVAQDLLATPNVSINSGTFAAPPASVNLTAAAFPIGGAINSYSLLGGGLSGTVTIGAAGTYPTLTGAGGLFAALNAGGLNGNLTVNILDAAVTETGANALNPINYGCAGPYTLTIKPGAGVTTTLSGSLASNALIRILSSNVVIDGSNNGSTSRNMTITNTNTTGPSVILLGSSGTTAITNITVKNATFINGINTNSAFVVSDGATLGNPGYFTNITIQNNSIQLAYIGLYCNATSLAGNGNGLLITGNSLNTIGANSIRYTGIYVQGADGAIVRGNSIGNFDGTSSEDDNGVWFAAGTVNSTIEKNTIFNLNYTGTSGYGAHGAYITTGVTGANIQVSNNMISNLSGDGWSYTSIPTDNPIGIAISGTQTGVNVYNNSINFYGNTLNQTSAAAMGIYLSAGSVANIRNNIINNNLGLLSATGYGAIGVYAVTANNQFTAIDYNDYFVNPTGSAVKYIGQIAATTAGTLSAWQTATGQEANSQNIAPVFISNTDLHLSNATGVNWCLNGKGVTIAGITTDIDGDTRGTPPDIGADEFVAVSNDVAAPLTQTICSGASITPITITGSAGSYTWTRNNTGTVTGIAASGTGNISGSLTNTTNAPVTVTFTILPTNGTCTFTPIIATVIVNPTPNAVATPSSQTICSASTITTIVLSGSVSGTTYGWTRDNTGSVTGIAASGSGDISGSLTNATNAPVTVTFTITPTANGCPGTPITATVVVNPTVSRSGGPGAQSICSGDPITPISFTSPTSGATFTWTRDNTGTVTGIPASGSGMPISGSLTNTTTSDITVTFTISVSANGCPGPDATVFVTVKAKPVISSSITQPTTCVSADGAIDITMSGAAGPYNYAWSTVGGSGLVNGQEDQSGLTLGQYTVIVTAANGCQATAVFNLIGPGGCDVCPSVGSMTTNPSGNTCVNSNVTLNAGGLTFMGVTYGITFKSFAAPTADPYTGGTVLATVPNAGLGGGGTTATANTNFAAAGTYYIYAILSPTPIDPSCRPSALATLTVSPNPTVNPVANGTFCNNTLVPTGTFNFTSPTTGTFNGKILIAYADVSAPTNLQSALLARPGVSQVDLFDASAGTPTLAQMQQYGIVIPFSNTGFADPVALGNNLADYVDGNGVAVPIGFSFYTTPYTPTGRWATGGYSPYTSGTNLDFTSRTLGTYNAGHPLMAGVTAMASNFHNVVPLAAGATEVAQWDNGDSFVAFKGRVVGITAYIGATATWSGDFANVIVNAGNWLGGGAISFSWTNNNTSIGLAASGTGTSLPTFTATNTGTTPVVATITVTATLVNGTATCPGPSTTFTITVNPTANVNPVPNQIVCNGANTTAVNFTGTVGGSNYTWTNNTTSIGLGASGIGNIPSFVAVNLTSAPVTATITVTPNYISDPIIPVSASSSMGAGFGTLLANTINGVGLASFPSLTATHGATIPTNSWVGNNGTLSGNITFDLGGSKTVSGLAFWNQNGGGPGANGSTGIKDVQVQYSTDGVNFNNVPGAPTRFAQVPGSANLAPERFSFAPVTATHMRFVVANNWGDPSNTGFAEVAFARSNCNGTPTSFTITVNPTPNAVATPSSQTICSGSNITPIVLSGNVASTTYSWTRNNTVAVTGIAASGTGNISGALTNTTNAPVTVTFTITPTANGCAGTPITATVVVNPTPDAVATPSTQTICSGSPMTTIVLSGSVAGTTFNWTRNNTVNVTGVPNSGSGNISGTPINNSGVQQTVTYTITPVANGCSGTPITATVIINIPPTITCPGNITVNNTPGVCGANVTYPPATASGSPAPVITYSQASGSFFPVGVTVVTATATNSCGVATCTFTITVVDNQFPTITCPGNIVRNTDPGLCTASIAVPNPTFADNCAVTTLTWTMTGATVASSPATGINFVGTRVFNLNGTTGQGVTTVTYTAKDNAGNIAICSFTVTVNDAAIPIISLQPSTKFACAGSPAVFSVGASAGGGPIAYQWQEWNGTAWVNIAGATSNSFTVPNVSFADNTRSFRVILTGLCSVVTSGAATLYINPVPTVSILPSIPPSLTPGQSLNLNAVASPTGGSYAWYFNGTLVPTRTGSTWNGITVDGIGTYKVVYTDPNGCVATSADLVVSGQQSSGLWVYPNPNTGRFLVRFYNGQNESITINVYDGKGSRILQKTASTTTAYTGVEIDLNNSVASGVYLVQVVNGSGKIIGAQRIVVRHQ